MKIKKEYLILVVIIAVLSLYLVIHKSDQLHYQLPELPQVSQKDISKIEITKENQTILIVKKNDNWMIGPNQYPADTEKVNNIVDVLDDLSVTALVSESDNYPRYELDEKNRIHVKAFKGEDLKRELFIGKTAPSFNHTFIRLKTDSRVYHAGGNFKSKFNQTVNDLRDKTALSFNPNDIQEISVTKDKKVIAFSKTQIPVEVKTESKKKKEKMETPPEMKPVWQEASGKAVEDSKVTSFLSTLKNLRCKTYLATENKEEFKDPIFTVLFKDAADHSLAVFAKEKETDDVYPAVSSQNKYPFALDSAAADRIMSAFHENKEEKKAAQ